MLNRVTIMGRLTRDPELRYTQTNTPVTSFAIAVDRDFKTQGGERETDFFDVVAWRTTAEFVNKYFSKGRMAVIEGKLQTRTWADKDNKSRKAVEVVAESVYFGDSKKDGDSAPLSTPPVSGTSYSLPKGFTELEDDDGELPF